MKCIQRCQHVLYGVLTQVVRKCCWSKASVTIHAMPYPPSSLPQARTRGVGSSQWASPSKSDSGTCPRALVQRSSTGPTGSLTSTFTLVPDAVVQVGKTCSRSTVLPGNTKPLDGFKLIVALGTSRRTERLGQLAGRCVWRAMCGKIVLRHACNH